MPALSGKIIHVFNRSVENINLFVDQEDYKVFINYLNEYLSSVNSLESAKKTFTVRGHTFSGVPHQPKNYFGKIIALAYELGPNKFHLILEEKESGTLERFIRSLCTRYSIYYNKKYQRIGSLFIGPYKSQTLSSTDDLNLLTRYLHRNQNEWSSYNEYTGKRLTTWLNTSLTEPSNSTIFSDTETQILTKISLEKEPFKIPDVLGRHPINTIHEPAESVLKPHATSPKPKGRSRIPEITGAFAIFLLLTALGLRNINLTKANNTTITVNPLPSPVVLAEATFAPTPIALATSNPVNIATESAQQASPSASLKTVKKVVVNVPGGSGIVNIRAFPAENAEIIGKARQGDSFEMVSYQPEWYEIKIAGLENGFVSTKFVEPDKNE